MLRSRVLIRTRGGLWAMADTIQDCVAKLKEEGATGVVDANITILVGDRALLKEVSVTRYGDIERPKGVESYGAGWARLSMKKVRL